jgi:hypothetical protein
MAASPRDALDLPSRIITREAANDVVGAARIGLTVALLGNQRSPKVLRAERLWIEGEPLWRVDVAGNLEGGGCAAIAAWIAEDGRIAHLSQTSELSANADCREWYFNGDALAQEAARDVVDPQEYRDHREPSTPAADPFYGSDEEWGIPADQWEEWRLEQPLEE